MPDLMVKLANQLEREAEGKDRPLPLPWPKTNFCLGGGLRPGTFNLLVGEPGSAKTFIALGACLHAQRRGHAWVYWPFERDDAYAARRLLATLVNRWDVLDPEASESVSGLINNDDEVFNAMARMTPNIEPNPRQLRVDEYGRHFIPACESGEVLERLRVLCSERELVVLDPLSMVSFDDERQDAWKGQERFAKDAAAIVAGSGSRLLIAHHTRKSVGGRPRESGLSEVAGAAALSRFADNVIFLEHHPDGIESEVILPEGIRKLTTHRRTLFIGKARDGRGTGWRIACDLTEAGPALCEYGIVQRKARL